MSKPKKTPKRAIKKAPKRATKKKITIAPEPFVNFEQDIQNAQNASATISCGNFFNFTWPNYVAYIVIADQVEFAVTKLPNKFHLFMMKLLLGWTTRPYTNYTNTATYINNGNSTPTGKQLLCD